MLPQQTSGCAEPNTSPGRAARGDTLYSHLLAQTNPNLKLFASHQPAQQRVGNQHAPQHLAHQARLLATKHKGPRLQ